MTINLTLFAQIIHFLIAYWMLRRWFFTPIFAIIERQDGATAYAERKLTQQRLHNEIKHQELVAEQEATQTFFNTNKPLIVEEMEKRAPMPELEVPELSMREQTEAKNKLTELLVRKAEQ